MSNPNIKISELEKYVTDNLSDPRQIAEFFYYWISLNIEYDYEKLKKIRANELTETGLSKVSTIFKEKKAVCIGFSTLYQEFLNGFNIKTEIITGYAKSDENLSLEPELDSDFLHAWNAILIDKEWVLVDVTWAKQFENRITDFYFDVAPDKLILTHYPIDNNWQLLNNPITISDFNELPYIHSFYFQTGFPEKPILTSDSEYYYFEFKKNPNRNWLVKLTYSVDNLNYESVFPEYIKNIDGFTYKFSKEKVPPNSIIRMDLTDFNEEKQTMISYEKIALFNL
ncbi:MAG: hypothetical protein KAT68_02435 [Bacteroidales bacterium]|nr:hypothetical protein [Bacteroidales bacterium]